MTSVARTFQQLVDLLDKAAADLPREVYAALLKDVENHVQVCIEAVEEDERRDRS